MLRPVVHPFLRVTAALILAMAISLLIEAHLRKYSLWLSLGAVWTLALGYVTTQLRGDGIRITLITVILGLILLVGFEGWLWSERPGLSKVRSEGNFREVEYFMPHETLGEGPRPGVTARFVRLIDDQVLYDVDYGINTRGLRKTPQVASPDACMLFFGGSFTFGEGVEDAQTLPWRVSERSQQRIQTYNFGFHGYGPHQMLAALEEGLAGKAIDCRPTHAVYQAIPHHLIRVIGRLPAGFHGPRFQLSKDGELRRAGFFDDESWLSRDTRTFLNRSLLFRQLIQDKSPISEHHKELFAAVVSASARELRRMNSELDFLVLLWRSGSEKLATDLAGRLRNRGLTVVYAEDVLRPLPQDQWTLGMGDPHPSAATHDRMAEFLIERWADMSGK